MRGHKELREQYDRLTSGGVWRWQFEQGALETMVAEDGWILKGEEPGPESNGRD